MATEDEKLRSGADQRRFDRFRPDTVPPPYSPIKMDSPTLVRTSYDHEATGHFTLAILDMLRALYQQQEEHMAWVKLRPDDPRRS